MTRNITLIFFLASFLEGGCLMAYEILSSKLYTPFIGSSMYVWVSILTITLIGLAFGYRLGGKISKRENVRKPLIVSFLVSGLYIFFSPLIINFMLPNFLNFEIEVATAISGFIILFVPVLFLGTISPLIVKEISLHNESVSKSTGLIFGIGTIGGIIFLLITAFYLIPNLGVKLSTQVIGGLLLSVAILLLLRLKYQKNG